MNETINNMFKLLERVLDKETPKKVLKTKKHFWRTDENGERDDWAYSCGFHNGPVCEMCGEELCIHCDGSLIDEEVCFEHFICKCGQHLKGTENYCPHCGQKLDWSK